MAGSGCRPGELQALLTPFPADEMEAYAVSTLVNSPRNDVPECLVPVGLVRAKSYARRISTVEGAGMVRLVTLLLGALLLLTVGEGQATADDLEPYCCVCTGCSAGTALQCFPVSAPGGAANTNCPKRCADQGCNFLEVLDGFCSENAATCMPSPAPAASHSVLLALGVLLAGCGVYLVRRRVTR